MEPRKIGSIVGVTLAIAQEWVTKYRHTKEGCICPACGKLAKVYTRKVSLHSLADLAGLYRLSVKRGYGFHHYSDFVVSKVNSEYEKLRFFELIERQINFDTKKKTSGMYRITQTGVDFLQGRYVIPEKMVLYNDLMIDVGFADKSITDFWPEFDYEELMSH